MPEQSHLTTGQVSSLLGVPVWRVRRTIDAMGVDVPRMAHYRLVPRSLLLDRQELDSLIRAATATPRHGRGRAGAARGT